MLGRPDTVDAPATRRWRLMARLALEIGSRKVGKVDLRDLVAKAAQLISEEIGDRTLILLDLPDHDHLVAVAAHREPSTYGQTQRLLDDLGETGLREWLGALAEQLGRTQSTLLRPASEAESATMRRIRRHRADVQMTDAAYAALRTPEGDMRGLVVCSRDPGSSAYDEFDRAALASAGDTISRELDLALAIAEKRALSHQRQLLLKQLVQAEQAERERIAQDVHDDPMQMLAAAQLRLDLLCSEFEPASTASAKAEAIGDLVRSAQKSLRNLLLNLTAGSGHGVVLEEALRQTAASFFADTDTAVTVDVTGAITAVPEDVCAVLLRAGREALSNARQHACATNVRVALDMTGTQWRFSVSDDGVGIPDTVPNRPGHLGLPGMVGRVAALGGRCTVARRSAGGTQVLIEIPARG